MTEPTTTCLHCGVVILVATAIRTRGYCVPHSYYGLILDRPDSTADSKAIELAELWLFEEIVKNNKTELLSRVISQG